MAGIDVPLTPISKTPEKYDGVYVLPGHYWRVGKRYKDLQCLSVGGNGVICGALDSHTSQRVVISKRDNLHSKNYCQRDLRELQVLSRFQKALGEDAPIPNIVDIILEPPVHGTEVSIFYVVQEAKEASLEHILQSGQIPTSSQTTLIIYQLIRALKLFHSANIIHRCIRPNHLLLDAECELKISDFRLAAVNGIESDPNFELLRFTDSYRIEHLHYWAPEVLINEELTPIVDIWSAGCIFAELLTGKKLFGSSDVRGQLDLIFGLLGAPTLEDFDFVKGDASRTALKAVTPCSPSFEEFFKGIDVIALDLLKKMLVFNPNNRVNAQEALEHPYFSEFHDPTDEPVYEGDVPMNQELVVSNEPLEVLRIKLIQEVLNLKMWLDTIEDATPLVNGHPWFVGSRYKNLEFLTKGCNGTICTAIDIETGDRVVVSKRDGLYSNEYCKRNLREIQILRQLQKYYPEGYEPFPRILDIVCYPPILSGPKQAELYVVQTAMDINLEDILLSQRLAPDQIWYLMYTMLVALKLLHSAGVVHRCLRPRHILLTSEMDVAICDLRRSIFTFASEGPREEYNWTGTATEGSWRYLSPEAICYAEQGTACDIWSAGCIFGEMLTGQPLFPSDANAANIFQLIFATLGRPRDEDLGFVKSDLGLQVLKELKYDEGPSLDEIMKGRNVNPQAIGLLKEMLTFNPSKRISAEQALKLPYFAKLHDAEEEPVYPSGKSLLNELIVSDLSTDRLRAKIVEEANKLALS